MCGSLLFLCVLVGVSVDVIKHRGLKQTVQDVQVGEKHKIKFTPRLNHPKLILEAITRSSLTL